MCTQLSLRHCLCEMHIKAVHGYVRIIMHIKLVNNRTKSDLKNNSLLKILSDTQRNENILPRTLFTQKYPMMNFS